MKNGIQTVQVQGNITSPAITCGINEDGLASVLSTLTNVYSNKNLAVIREYSANARDSHVEAGNEAPIEVTLPTLLQPTFLVQDYGIGLDKDEILNVFGAYGSSTKRNTNSLVGALGIGSKAAFTLGQQFIVTGVKDGRKTVVLFSLDASNLPTMSVIADEVPTEEPNGVLVSLAVEDVTSFSEEAHKFFRLWQRGSVLVDGEEPTPIWESVSQINENTFISDDDETGVYVVMGAIRYRVEPALLRSVRDTFEADDSAYSIASTFAQWDRYSSVLIRVEIGDVDIAPSRESLRDTPHTITTLAQRVQEIAETLSSSVQDKVNAEPNAFAAIQAFEHLREQYAPLKVSRKDVTYHGLRLTENVKVLQPIIFLSTRNGYRGGEYKSVTTDPRGFDLSVKQAAKTLVVRLAPNETVTQVSRLAKRFLEDTEYDHIVATHVDALSFGWFTFGGVSGGVTTWTLAEYRAACKELRANDVSTSGRREPRYRTGTGFTQAVQRTTPLSDLLAEGKPLVVLPSSKGRKFRYELPLAWREALSDDYVIVRLWGPQTDATLRKRAEAEGIEVLDAAAAQEIVTAFAEAKYAPTDEERKALGARKWLAYQGIYAPTTWERLVDHYGVDQITSETVLANYQTIMTARTIMNMVTSERYTEIESTSAEAIPFEGVVLDIAESLPVLDFISLYKMEREPLLSAHVLEYINSY